jgi:glutamate-5-semialdehyde dehydrogenase
MEKDMRALGKAAKIASATLATSTSEQRDLALRSAALSLRSNKAEIQKANDSDMHDARGRKLGEAMLDRLMLDDSRIESMAAALESICELPDPIGKSTAEWERPNGLNIQRVTVPLGVIGIIYESRPNVTADAAALCLKSGNAVILRGGSESYRSNQAIYECMRDGLDAAVISADAIQMVPTRDRAAVGYLLSSMAEWVDVVIPRGGKSLIKRVQDEARVPVIGHLEGICHVYLHSSADPDVAREVVLNAKMRRTGICGAAETLLVDAGVAEQLLPDVCTALTNAGCEIRGDEQVMKFVADAIPATVNDWSTEYLDSIVSIRVVDNLDAAIEHIASYGSGHTESIIATDTVAAEQFLRRVDSAIVLHNASTQFADGGEIGRAHV